MPQLSGNDSFGTGSELVHVGFGNFLAVNKWSTATILQ
jgi:hypothetical protein